jgi:superkiller protein 3
MGHSLTRTFETPSPITTERPGLAASIQPAAGGCPYLVRRSLALLTFFLLTPVAQTAAQGVKVSSSMEELEEAVDTDPYDPTAHYNLALGLWSKRKHEEAEGELRRSVELDPRFALGWLALAIVPLANLEDLEQERLEETKRQYRHAFMLDPLVDVRIIAAVKQRWLSSGKAIDEFEKGNYESAYEELDELVQVDEDRVWLLWYRGIAAAHLGMYEHSVRDIETLIARLEEIEEGEDIVHASLGTNEYRYLLAYLEHRLGNSARAIELYREALVYDIGLYMAHVRLAEIHEEQGDWQQALTERRRAIDANPDDPTLLTDLGRTLAQMQMWDEARQAMHRAVEANPDDPRPWYFRGLLDLKAGDQAEARAAFREFLARAPSKYVDQVEDARTRLEAMQ